MGEKTEFSQGDTAPNDGTYIEIGENDFHMGINDPLMIDLKQGQKFPENKNHNRKWKRFNQ
ncbi:YjzC family protein [Paenibacillus albiflavus]|uniref:YjzC family protein n=1 Tax=Paenibacillus albiflavus TaxID=2545760 RepID=A0A4R4ECK6_9BACL|nr:YjzC family protein [Paenibacillus albiflavus]TCZ75678.1 YjzC family protein [Paenibacillus albiflavus]